MKPVFQFSMIVTLAGLLMGMYACHREKPDFIGPAYISAPEGFAVTSFSATPSPVNFLTGGTVTFNAVFTSSVSWILTIKGQTSGAIHEISGTSDNLNKVWTGKHDNVFFFLAGETATATLSFYNTSITSSVNIIITAVNDYTKCSGYLAPRYGDFETPAKVFMSWWERFNAVGSIQGIAGHNMDGAGKDSLATDRYGNFVPPVQGKNYYYMKGLGTQPVFVDGIATSTKAFTKYPVLTASTLPLPTNPDDVWINVYAYGTGDANAQLQLQVDEDDNGDDGATYIYIPASDDGWQAFITLNHKGWKLFSFQYSKLTIAPNPLFGGNGNKIMEPNNLARLEFILLKASDPNSPVEVYFDYPIITVGGPFIPCK